MQGFAMDILSYYYNPPLYELLIKWSVIQPLQTHTCAVNSKF